MPRWLAGRLSAVVATRARAADGGVIEMHDLEVRGGVAVVATGRRAHMPGRLLRRQASIVTSAALLGRGAGGRGDVASHAGHGFVGASQRERGLVMVERGAARVLRHCARAGPHDQRQAECEYQHRRYRPAAAG